MKRRLLCMILVFCLLAGTGLTGCGSDSGGGKAVPEKEAGESSEPDAGKIEYSFATKDEGIEYLDSNEEYYAGVSQKDLEYKMQKKNASMEEYRKFVRKQVRSFSDEDKKRVDEAMADIESRLHEQNYTLPELDPIVFINTTMKEELGAAGYTHGTQIYLGMDFFSERDKTDFCEVIAHELFHCLTRCNPDFRSEMYSLIHFTTREKEGESFFDYSTPVLVPIDGSDVYYTPEDTSDFDDVFGRNTDYVVDPEECMADNFAFALVYGEDGPEGKGYKTPEIIEGILAYLSKNGQ